MDPGRFFRGVVENDFDVLSDSGDIVVDSSNQKRGNEKSSRSRPPRHSSRSSSRSASPQKRIHVPRADDAVYEDSTNEYLFEWVGKEPRDIHREHPQHVFRSPSYWRYYSSRSDCIKFNLLPLPVQIRGVRIAWIEGACRVVASASVGSSKGCYLLHQEHSCTGQQGIMLYVYSGNVKIWDSNE